ncbi:2-dehydropantoate 2-reductase [Photobacterium aphoticum]|uniref:2-dehydropantoate 2-reductase n=1 Tax=Photobacterium aphoticum TaxID=754436 RepID=A0A090QWY1_9GAMM|nr:2-dehydropantoate 2-reductase [Photobacterium aphoticum]
MMLPSLLISKEALRVKITIVGAGAIGLLWGTHLSQHHSVHFWTRDNASSLNITVQPLPSQPDTPPSVPCTFDFVANHTAWVEQADCVLVTVKAFQVLEALQAIQPYLAEKHR